MKKIILSFSLVALFALVDGHVSASALTNENSFSYVQDDATSGDDKKCEKDCKKKCCKDDSGKKCSSKKECESKCEKKSKKECKDKKKSCCKADKE